MNDLKLITTHPDYWLLVDTETYLCDKTIAYLSKYPDAPALEGVLQLPELPKEEEAMNAAQYLLDYYKCKDLKQLKRQEDDFDIEDAIKHMEGYKAAFSKGCSNTEEQWGYMSEISDECCDKVGYAPIVGKVFQWLIDNGYIVAKFLSPTPTPVGFEPIKEYLSNTGEWKGALLPSEWEIDTQIRFKTIKSGNGEILQGRWLYETKD